MVINKVQATATDAESIFLYAVESCPSFCLVVCFLSPYCRIALKITVQVLQPVTPFFLSCHSLSFIKNMKTNYAQFLPAADITGTLGRGYPGNMLCAFSSQINSSGHIKMMSTSILCKYSRQDPVLPLLPLWPFPGILSISQRPVFSSVCSYTQLWAVTCDVS